MCRLRQKLGISNTGHSYACTPWREYWNCNELQCAMYVRRTRADDHSGTERKWRMAKRVHDSPWLQLSSRSNTLLSKPSSGSGTESWSSSGGTIPLSRIRFRSCVMVNTQIILSWKKIMTVVSRLIFSLSDSKQNSYFTTTGLARPPYAPLLLTWSSRTLLCRRRERDKRT